MSNYNLRTRYINRPAVSSFTFLLFLRLTLSVFTFSVLFLFCQLNWHVQNKVQQGGHHWRWLLRPGHGLPAAGQIRRVRLYNLRAVEGGRRDVVSKQMYLIPSTVPLSIPLAAAVRLRNKQTPAAPSTSRQHCTVSRSRPIRASRSCVPVRRRCSTISTRSPTGTGSCNTSRARRSGKGRNGRKTGRRGECGCGIWSMARCSNTSARS